MTPKDLLRALARTDDPYHPPLPDIAPGLTGDDQPIYERWLRSPTPNPKVVFYNVRVGPDPEARLKDADIAARITAQLRALRIDLLVYDGVDWTILELHRTCDLPQFGRLLGYPFLLRRTYPISFPIHTLAITTTCNPFLLPLFTAHRIPVIAYTPEKLHPTPLNPQSLTERR